jgi:AcrR family transcriptional regulator
MVRWEPGATDRLRVAALELYVGQGFEQTTVGEIAKSVGLTERTFFRHFADKKEVLFGGEELLEQSFVDAVSAAPPDLSPLELIASALDSIAEYFPEDRRTWSRQRHQVIQANQPLKERELLKLARLGTKLTEAFSRRGVAGPAAALAGQTCVTVFSVAFGRWIADGETRPLAEIARATVNEFRTLVVTVETVEH